LLKELGISHEIMKGWMISKGKLSHSVMPT
jgi:hypothetical protein